LIDWDIVLSEAERYQSHRLETLTRYLPELRAVIDRPVQNWTDPYGRGYQYEFELSGPAPAVSLIVEVSAIAPLAAAYYARRTTRTDGSYYDECSDSSFTAEDAKLRERVRDTLESLGVTLVPYEELNVVRRGKPTFRWLFHDSEE
jgi:hypothetical protein